MMLKGKQTLKAMRRRSDRVLMLPEHSMPVFPSPAASLKAARRRLDWDYVLLVDGGVLTRSGYRAALPRPHEG